MRLEKHLWPINGHYINNNNMQCSVVDLGEASAKESHG